MRGIHALLYIGIRDPQSKSERYRSDSWRFRPNFLETAFDQTTWSPRSYTERREVDALLKRDQTVRLEAKDGDLEGPLLVSGPELAMEAFKSNYDEEELPVHDSLFEMAAPKSRTFGIAIARNGIAKHGNKRFYFPDNIYLDICNTNTAEGLERLSNRVWDWLGTDLILELLDFDWVRHPLDWKGFELQPRVRAVGEFNWFPSHGELELSGREWPWFGEWDTFRLERDKLMRLVTAFQAGRWSDEHSKLLAAEMDDKVSVVPMNSGPWDTIELDPEDFGQRPQWADQVIDIRVMTGIWALPYVELDLALQSAKHPARCPDCGRFLPQEPRRHSDRRCDECRDTRRRSHERKRARKYRAKRPPLPN